MTKAELVSRISELTGVNKVQVNNVLGSLASVIEKNVIEDNDRISLPGFATFLLKETKGGDKRNPLTGKTVYVPSKKKIVCKISPSLTRVGK